MLPNNYVILRNQEEHQKLIKKGLEAWRTSKGAQNEDGGSVQLEFKLALAFRPACSKSDTKDTSRLRFR